MKFELTRYSNPDIYPTQLKLVNVLNESDPFYVATYRPFTPEYRNKLDNWLESMNC